MKNALYAIAGLVLLCGNVKAQQDPRDAKIDRLIELSTKFDERFGRLENRLGQLEAELRRSPSTPSRSPVSPSDTPVPSSYTPAPSPSSYPATPSAYRPQTRPATAGSNIILLENLTCETQSVTINNQTYRVSPFGTVRLSAGSGSFRYRWANGDAEWNRFNLFENEVQRITLMDEDD